MKPEAILQRARQVYLALPDAQEVLKWGSPHMVVADKILGGASLENGRVTISMKLEPIHAVRRIKSDDRFTSAKYVGKHGWVVVDITDEPDWKEVEALVREGYRLVAPKSSLAKLGESSTEPTAKKAVAKKAPTAKKAPPKKTAR